MDLIAFLSAAIIAKGVYAVRLCACACAWQKSLCCCRAVSLAITHARTHNHAGKHYPWLPQHFLAVLLLLKVARLLWGLDAVSGNCREQTHALKSNYSNITTGKVSFVFQIIITIRFRFETMTWAPIRVPRTRILKFWILKFWIVAWYVLRRSQTLTSFLQILNKLCSLQKLGYVCLAK